MSASIPAGPIKPGPSLDATVFEVQGIFALDPALQDAIARLTQAGFDRADLSLPDANPAASRATPELGAAMPTTETDLRQARTLGTSMAGTIGAFAAAGAVIATGGAAALAIGAAAIAGAGSAAVANAAGTAATQVQTDAREDAALRGELVLSARATDPGRRALAERLMREAGASRVEAVRRTDGAIEIGTSAR